MRSGRVYYILFIYYKERRREKESYRQLTSKIYTH